MLAGTRGVDFAPKPIWQFHVAIRVEIDRRAFRGSLLESLLSDRPRPLPARNQVNVGLANSLP
jgi:hypothetical protein